MPQRVCIQHHTHYRYQPAVRLGPQRVRLRPAAHTRTPVTDFSLRIEPDCHLLYWQQDPYNNWEARVLFQEPVGHFEIIVALTAELVTINPFDFILEPEAANFPFQYEAGTHAALYPYLHLQAPSPPLFRFLTTLAAEPQPTVTFLTDLNRAVFERVRYLLRMAPGVQTPEETLALGEGSCRDSAWLLVHLLRHLGLAARFVSGYVVNLDDAAEDHAGDRSELHAWTEVFLPGAGWVGLDPSSGLMAAAGHIPVAATAEPEGAAPVSGMHEPCEVSFSYDMRLRRADSAAEASQEA